MLFCPHCGATREVICPVSMRNKRKCKCGENMKVKITTANVLSRGIPLRTRQWMRKRDL